MTAPIGKRVKLFNLDGKKGNLTTFCRISRFFMGLQIFLYQGLAGLNLTEYLF